MRVPILLYTLIKPRAVPKLKQNLNLAHLVQTIFRVYSTKYSHETA